MLDDVEAFELAVLSSRRFHEPRICLMAYITISATPPTTMTHAMLPMNCAFSWSTPPP